MDFRNFTVPTLPAITGWRTYAMWLVSVLVLALLSGWYFGKLPAMPELASPFETYATVSEVAATTATVRMDLKSQAEAIRILETRIERVDALRRELDARVEKAEAWQAKATPIATGAVGKARR